VEDLTFTSKTHVARIRVMETTSGLYRGYVYLSRAAEGPNDDHPYQTDADRERYDLALDDAKILAHRLLLEFG
jgi:hypothetical protein